MDNEQVQALRFVAEFFLAVCVGLSCGSFVTLASWRMPRSEDIVIKPSRCPSCDTRLGFWDLWPVLTWILTFGHCRYCKKAVPLRYPLTELLTGIIFGILFFKYGITLQGIMLATLGVLLMIMIVVDLEHYIIPDQLHYVLLPLGLAYNWVLHNSWDDVLHGFLLGAGVGLTLHYGYRHLRGKEGLGFGDVKFLAIAGVWLGLKPVVPFLFFAGVFGVVTGLIWRSLKKGPIFPFGPSLALSLFLCVAFPEVPKLFWNIGQFMQ